MAQRSPATSGSPSTGVDVEQESAARAFLRHCVARGVRAAFGIPGGTVSPMFDALRAVPQIDCVTTRHENMAAFAALGHARATGQPALVFTTSGPGITNAITGLAAAELEEVPLILIGGEVATQAMGRGTIQDGSPAGLAMHSMLRSITRWCGSLTAPESAAAVAERAYHEATGRRPGPVFVSVALDAGAAESRAMTIAPGQAAVRPRPDAQACAEVARELARAKRPLLVLGNGARSAAAAALRLATRVGIPVIATGHAKGTFPESNPLYLGVMGLGQHPTVGEYLEQQPDVTLIVGTRLNDITTNGWSVRLCGSLATIQVDRNPELIGRNAPVDLGIVGDARSALEQIYQALPKDVVRSLRPVRGCRSIRAELADSDAVPLKPQRVLAALQEAFPQATWCSDIGEHLSHALHYLRVDSPHRFHTLLGLGSMASGFGVSIGYKRARPHETVISLCGDGGFAMHAGEILTCAENDVAVLFVIFNDGRWNMVDHGFDAVYGQVPACLPNRLADLGGVASAFGAVGIRVATPDDLDIHVLRRHIASGRPVVLDARIDWTESLTKDTRSASLKHFKGSADQ